MRAQFICTALALLAVGCARQSSSSCSAPPEQFRLNGELFTLLGCGMFNGESDTLNCIYESNVTAHEYRVYSRKACGDWVLLANGRML